MSALTTPRPPTYPVQMAIRARELRHAHWSIEETLTLLEREFNQRPAQSTVSRWCCEIQHTRDLLTNKQRSARQRAELSGGRFRRLPTSPEFKLARMRALRDEAGLKDVQIARVMTFDYGESMSRAMVEYALQQNRYPRSLR